MPALRHRAIALACFASIAAVVWFWLGHLEHIDWLTVEGSAHAVVGEPVRLSVHVTRLPANAVLCVDLHWAQDRNTSMGFLAAGKPRAVEKTGGIFDFTIPVPARDNLRFVKGIIYLSLDGNWNNHTFAATTDLIPIAIAPGAQATGLVWLPVRQLAEDATRVIQPRTLLLRWATGFLWLFGAVMLGRRLWIGCSIVKNTAILPRKWWVIAVGFALAGIWELAGLENTLGNWARSFARAEDIYYSRIFFQRVVISVTVATVIAWLGFGGRRRTFPRWLLSFGFYLAIATVNLFSLHAIDQYASASWHGLAFVDAMKFSCAVIALCSLSAQGRNLKLAAKGSGTRPG